MLGRLGATVALLASAAFATLGGPGLSSPPSAFAESTTPLTLEQPNAGEVFVSDSAGVFSAVFTGLGAFGDLVTVSDPAADPICEGLVHDDGTWACTGITMADFFGEVTVSDSVTVIGRLIGAVNPPRLDASQSGGISTDAAGFVTSGTAAPGASVEVFLDGAPACDTVADAGGAWSCALALTDADVGSSSLTATQTPPYATTASAPSPPAALVYRLPVVVIPVVPTDPIDPAGPGDPGGPGGPAGSGGPGVPGVPADPVTPVPGTPSTATGDAASPAASEAGSPWPGDTGTDPSSSSSSDSSDSSSDPPVRMSENGRPSTAQSSAGDAPEDSTAGRPDSRTLGADAAADGSPRPSGQGTPSAHDAGPTAASAPTDHAATGWNDPTGFGTSLRPPMAIPFSSPAYALSVFLVAAGFLLLLALPAELLQSTVRENHDRIAPVLNRLRRLLPARAAQAAAVRSRSRRVLGPLVIVLVTAAVSAFADPSAGIDARSLRLVLALALVMLVVNGLGILAGGLLAARVHRAATVVAPRPFTLLLVVATVLLSRVAEIQPGLLFGLVLGVEFGTRLRRRHLARITVVTSVTLLGLGLASWFAFGMLAPAWQAHPDVANQLAGEVLTGITVETLAGLAIALLPLTFLDGGSVFSVSRVAWAALYAVALAAFAAVIIPLPSSWVEVPSLLSPWAIGFAAFSAISMATWAYFRFTGPRTRPDAGAEATRSASETDRPRPTVSGSISR